MAQDKDEKLEGSLTDGGSLPGEDEERSFGAAREKAGGKLPGEADASTQRGRDLPDGGYEPPDGAEQGGEESRGYGG